MRDRLDRARARSAPRSSWRTAAIIACVWLAVAPPLSACSTSARTALDASANSETVSEIDTFALVREAADHEALYTLVGGLKPMSTGFWSGSYTVENPDLSALRAVRAALEPLRTDIWYADVQVFNKIHDGERFMHAFIVHRQAMARMIEHFEAFWNPWGITPCSHPSEVIGVVDRMPRADRWRGYGYLFGYPADAVDFFVEAGLAARDHGTVGPGKDRSFVQIKTYAADTGRFTYAVPISHVPTTGDKALAAEAGRILAGYRERRDQMQTTRGTLAELRRLNNRFERTARVAAEARDSRYARGVTDAVLDAR